MGTIASTNYRGHRLGTSPVARRRDNTTRIPRDMQNHRTIIHVRENFPPSSNRIGAELSAHKSGYGREKTIRLQEAKLEREKRAEETGPGLVYRPTIM